MRVAASPPKHLRTEAAVMSGLAAATGGIMDAWVFIDHGHVFANAQTGNIVLLAIALAQGDVTGAARHGPSLLAFLVGLLASRGAAPWLRRRGNARTIRLAITDALLMLLACVADRLSDHAVTAGIGLIAGILITSLSRIGGWSFNTGMVTGDMRSGVDALGLAVAGDGSEWPHAWLMTLLTVAFLLGALLGAWLTPRLHGATLLVAAATVATALVVGRRVPDPVPAWRQLGQGQLNAVGEDLRGRVDRS